MGIIANPELVPELQYWFYNFVINSEVNKHEVPAPVPVDTIFLPEKSFVEMLFNESYAYDEYKYLYLSETRLQCWPELVRLRLCVYAGSSKYMILDDSGTNAFGLQAHDFTMLDSLLAYRQDSTALTMIDSTSVIFDSTADILYANFDSLNTSLSKMIFLYLDLKINGNYENYNNLTLITHNKTLETMYELVLIDEFFKFMTAREVDVAIICPT